VNRLTFGQLDHADVRAADVRHTPKGSRWTLVTPSGSTRGRPCGPGLSTGDCPTSAWANGSPRQLPGSADCQRLCAHA
jgi:hypothetical protein